MSEEQRTLKQNNCFHKYIADLAAKMAEGGLDMRTVIQVPIKPTPENVKEEMIRPVLKSLYPEKKSTTQLTTKQQIELYEVINAATAEKLGISLDWPTRWNGGKCDD